MKSLNWECEEQPVAILQDCCRPTNKEVPGSEIVDFASYLAGLQTVRASEVSSQIRWKSRDTWLLGLHVAGDHLLQGVSWWEEACASERASQSESNPAAWHSEPGLGAPAEVSQISQFYPGWVISCCPISHITNSRSYCDLACIFGPKQRPASLWTQAVIKHHYNTSTLWTSRRIIIATWRKNPQGPWMRRCTIFDFVGKPSLAGSFNAEQHNAANLWCTPNTIWWLAVSALCCVTCLKKIHCWELYSYMWYIVSCESAPSWTYIQLLGTKLPWPSATCWKKDP